ncbi:MAG: response regulator transcription factor [gamma proteobacterium symbiont of Bathyaustriella thionipta]|nr:response regulator transcription factor [gamma proteobacterium symbiont of Bathyaustriella thionipta]
MKQPDKQSPQTRKLLLVDDDEIFCLVLQKALQKRGFEVHSALSLQQAKQIARRILPDYAIVDLRIAQESGLLMVEYLRHLHADMYILMLTGYASIATAVEAIKLGATHYLTKPADADQIMAAFARTQGDAATQSAASPPSAKRLEWEHLQRVLMENNGNISATARALGMHRRTLQRKLGKRPVKE